MTDYEKFGPWIGNAVHVPPARRGHRHIPWVKPVFIALCIIAVCLGLAAALAGYQGPQL
ncbi:hypothetical protein [uncultured Devosia sp.]|uniref:hypothetical protein n=1 Tax=uncultured Devosia sp. TaxID=211434 RepID=UPI002617DFE3|nr:hypothetical protein [uncultured Devosia sp.]